MKNKKSILDLANPLTHAVFALGLLVLALYQATNQGAVIPVEWVPQLDISLTFLLDHLSLLFVTLICVAGFFVHIYAGGYMKSYEGRTMFHIYLTLFMLAMLGIVTANNIISLFVFWELTSLTSYLLIGFNHENKVSRRNALQAVIVTGAGGLSLLAGLILLGHMAGSYEINTIIANASQIGAHEYFNASLALILLGAFTKSAQFPFHFWLPNAMAAPTPVSAFLHSATMVKAGIFLLARFMPVYAQSDYWDITLMSVGGFTALWTGIVALKQTDIKLMLAYSTNVALGQLVFLLGLGTPYALSAAILFIVAHASYKASLFMVAGTIDKKAGTRDIEKLSGLRQVMIISFGATVLAALSKAGMIPLLGFVSKEYMYKASLEASDIALSVLFVVNMCIVALAFIIMTKPFWGKPLKAKADKAPGLNIFMWLPPAILGLVGIILPLAFLPWMETSLIAPFLLGMQPDIIPPEVLLWQGFNKALAASVMTLLLGGLLYVSYPKLKSALKTLDCLPKADNLYDGALDLLLNAAGRLTNLLQHGKLRTYLMLFFAVLFAFVAPGIPDALKAFSWSAPNGEFFEYALAAFIVLSLPLIIWAPGKVFAIIALGVFGFLIALTYMIYSAPDVAKTQILVETLLLIFLAIILRRLPIREVSLNNGALYKLGAVILSLALGFALTLALISVNAQTFDTMLGDFYAAYSMPVGFGRNIVNVILVDFRALDTFGEILVVVIACLAASLVLPLKNKSKKGVKS